LETEKKGIGQPRNMRERITKFENCGNVRIIDVDMVLSARERVCTDACVWINEYPRRVARKEITEMRGEKNMGVKATRKCDR
jgi:hypothetical protein